MTKKHSGLIWLTYPGQTVYENLNPYWAFFEKEGKTPDRIIILHAVEAENVKNETVRAFSIISSESKNKAGEIATVAFDDENVDDFCEKAENIFREAAAANMKIIVDISPTSWSFVPVYLKKIAEQYPDLTQSVTYYQYLENRSRKLPYPLIPRTGIVVHNFK
jgi:hypothetical protein